ncbi:MAG TPA: ATP synthase subunit I [Rudaea sp.]
MFQIGVIGIVGLGFCAMGWSAGAAAWFGGAVIACGNALFAWRLFADGVAPTRRIMRSVYAAEVLKWCWLAGMLYLALAVLKVDALPFLVGLIAAQVAFWVSLAVVR